MAALGGLAIAWTALMTIATFAWRYPTQDQFRLYRSYLELAFPQNVLQIENQHRPIVPGLLRVAEIHLRDADQWLQIVVGAALAAAAALSMVVLCLRSRAGTTATRWAGASASLIAVFWLGNARMLLHGNELVHTYLVASCAVAVAWCGWRAAQRDATRWLALGSIAATIATFSFGPGIALFPALLVLARLQRVPWRACAIPLLACAACLVVYTRVLPGDDNVRLAMSFQPWQTALTATRRLASPWVNAWLGFADPPMFPWHVELLARDHAWLAASANAVQQASGLTWPHGLAWLLGGAGLGVLARATWRAWRTGELSPVQACSLVLLLFGAACAGIVGIARLEFMLQRPDQVFADRYLPWPCLFWLGVALWLLASSSRAVRGAAVAGVMLLPLALWPTHELGAGWGASVFRSVQATAAAARSDLLDPDVFWRDDPSVTFEDKLHTLQRFREQGLAMYAAPGARALGTIWQGTLVANPSAAVHASAWRPVHDVRGPVSADRFELVVAGDSEDGNGDGIVVILDPDSRIVGYAEPAFDPAFASPLRWTTLRLRGYEAFVRDHDPARRYRVAWLDHASGNGVLLGELPPAH